MTMTNRWAMYPGFLIILLFSLFLSSSGANQNPGTSSTEYKKKEIQLKEVLKISDKKGDFYFKYPEYAQYFFYSANLIQVDNEGAIYVLDSNRILVFDSGGNFKKNLVNQGLGPGEATNISNFLLNRDYAIIHNSNPSKIIRLDKKGKHKEFRVQDETINRFFLFNDDAYYFFVAGVPVIKDGHAEIMDVTHTLVKVSPKGKLIGDVFSCPVKQFVARNGGLGQIDLGKLLVTPYKEDYFFVSHARKYMVKLFDLKKKKIVRSFARKYERQKVPENLAVSLSMERVTLNGRKFYRPPQKYLNDIQKLLVYKDTLWVVTSTADKEKGVLVDVFQIDGKYIGNFYLKLSYQADYCSFNGYIFADYLYTIERDEADNPLIVKYKIEF